MESDDILPISEDGNGGWTKNETFNGLLKKYGITKYYQAFPTAPTDWLLDIYVLEGDTLIAKELRSAFAKEISLVETNSTEFYSLTGSDDVYSQSDAFGLFSTQSHIGVRIPDGVRTSLFCLFMIWAACG